MSLFNIRNTTLYYTLTTQGRNIKRIKHMQNIVPSLISVYEVKWSRFREFSRNRLSHNSGKNMQ